ncbi:hypothetical protein QV65_32280 [Rhodococcus erythropolis]|nr:hypothetical protein QV65_32280 [Rhodococcus erythropolis]
MVSDSMRSRSANWLRSAHLSIGRATSARRQEDQTVIDFVQLEPHECCGGIVVDSSGAVDGRELN